MKNQKLLLDVQTKCGDILNQQNPKYGDLRWTNFQMQVTLF